MWTDGARCYPRDWELLMPRLGTHLYRHGHRLHDVRYREVSRCAGEKHPAAPCSTLRSMLD